MLKILVQNTLQYLQKKKPPCEKATFPFPLSCQIKEIPMQKAGSQMQMSTRGADTLNSVMPDTRLAMWATSKNINPYIPMLSCVTETDWKRKRTFQSVVEASSWRWDSHVHVHALPKKISRRFLFVCLIDWLIFLGEILNLRLDILASHLSHPFLHISQAWSTIVA